jgi:dTDP-4-amino-4,6-dideoxygalactose transaminase
MIDLFHPYVPEEVVTEVVKTLHTRWIGQGPAVDEFEELFSEQFLVSNCVSMNSGTAALETAYELVGIKPGDEVITTPLTCTATNIPLLRMGAKLVWVDIDRDTLCLSKDAVKSAITSKTKAIVNVHLGGIENDLGDMPVPVISDACQALGVFKGDYTCCSFQAIKHITTGDGGMLVCPTEADRDKAKLMRWFGIDRDKKMSLGWQAYKERQMTFDIELLGYKRQMTDIAATMGIVGLRYYNNMIAHRRYLHNIYRTNLYKNKRIKVIDGMHNTYWLFTVLVDDRDGFAKKLFEAGIDTNVVQLRNDIFKIFGGERQNLPVMNEVEYKYISLPTGQHVSEKDVEYICSVINEGW